MKADMTQATQINYTKSNGDERKMLVVPLSRVPDEVLRMGKKPIKRPESTPDGCAWFWELSEQGEYIPDAIKTLKLERITPA